MNEIRSRWTVPLACFIGLFVSAAPVFFSIFGLFSNHYIDVLGLSRTQAALGPMLALLTAAIVSPIAGAFVDRFGTRRVLTVGCVAFPAALLAYGTVPMTFPLYVVLASATGLACGIVSPAVYLTLPPQYFVKQLGLSLGLGILGLGAGLMLMPLVAGSLITSMGPDRTWQVLAVIVAVIGLANVMLLVRDNPAYRPLSGATPALPLPGTKFRIIASDMRYWVLNLGFLGIIMATSGVTLHFPAILMDRGFSAQTAALALSIIGLGSIVARLITGLMLDRLPMAVPAILFFGGQALGLLVLMSGTNGAAPFVAALFIGCSLGAEGDLMPFAIKRFFGLRAFARAYGLSLGLYQMGAAVGGLAMGAVFDRFKSYDVALLSFAIVTAIATALILLALNLLRRSGSVPEMQLI